MIIAVLVLLLGMSVNQCRRTRASYEDALSGLQLKETELKKSKDDHGREVAEFTATLLTMKQLNQLSDKIIDSLKKENKHFKKLASHTSVTMTTTDTLYLPAKDSTVTHGDTTERVKTFAYSDNFLTLNGILMANKVKLTYNIFNTVSLDYQWNKPGFFKRPVLSGTITQSNPHTTTDRVVQFTVKTPDKVWYEQWWFPFTIGIVAGSTGAFIILH